MSIKMPIVTSALLLAAGFAQPALADTIIFQEDFESYSEGSAVGGTGGWTGTPLVGTGSGLGSKTLNGRLYPGSRTQHWATNSFAPEGLNPTERYTLSFDAYAYGTNPVTHNAGLYFHNPTSSATGFLHIGWFYIGVGSGATKWIFDARGLKSDNSNWMQRFYLADYPSLVNNRVNLSVILDPSKNEVYGLAKFGDQVVETNHFFLSDENLSVIDGILIHQDMRQPGWYRGADFDNIVVTSTPISTSPTDVPEPSLLLGLVVTGSIMMLRRKNRQQD